MRPTARGRACRGRLLEQLRRLHDERVEVDEVSVGEEVLVLREEPRVVGVQLIAAQPVHGEAREDLRCGVVRADDPPQHGALLLLVDDAEPRAEPHVRPVLAQQLGAEGVDRPSFTPSARDPRRRASRSAISPAALLVKVNAQMRAGVDPELLEQEADPLDEAERLPRPGTGEDERRPRWRFDRLPL